MDQEGLAKRILERIKRHTVTGSIFHETNLLMLITEDCQKHIEYQKLTPHEKVMEYANKGTDLVDVNNYRAPQTTATDEIKRTL